MKIEKSELLTLLNQRYKDLGLGEDIPYRTPAYKVHEEPRLIAAARKHAEAWPSDPFAYGRVLKDIRRGLVSPTDVFKDARALIAVADAAQREEAKHLSVVEVQDAA